MSYIIKAYYSTGDSFHTEEASHELSPVWNDLEVAKQALQYLNEHHKAYEFCENRDRDASAHMIKNLKESVKNESWYINSGSLSNSEGWYYSIKLPLDDGTFTQDHISYHGYFEHLSLLAIETYSEESDGMSFRY